MNEIVGIGANVHDTLIFLDEYPKEDTKKRTVKRKFCGGGPCATGLVAAAKLGACTAFIGDVSDSGEGTFLRGDFEHFGVSTEYVGTKVGYTQFSSYVLLSEKNETRTVVFDRGNMPETELDTARLDAVRNARILMVDGNELNAAVSAAMTARESGTTVLYDAGGLYDGIERLLPLADVLVPSEEFALGITGKTDVCDAAKVLFEKYKPRVIIITQGVKGGVIYDGTEVKPYPAFHVHVVDTNGAGDVFHGALAFALLNNYNYYDACVFSSAVSALKCTKPGARDGVPTFEETKKFLKEQGIDGKL